MKTEPDKNETFAGDLQTGPFDDTKTKTFKISPIEVTITETRKSSHVPAPEHECSCGGGGLSADDIMRMATNIGAVVGKATPPEPTSPFDTSDARD